MPYIEFNRCFAAYALSTILVPVGFPLSSRQERCGLKIYLAYVLSSQLRLSRILLRACERALILPTSAGEASPPPVLRRTCRCSIPHSARKLQNPHLLTKLHASWPNHDSHHRTGKPYIPATALALRFSRTILPCGAYQVTQSPDHTGPQHCA